MRKITNEELGRPTAGEFAAMEKMPVTVVLDNVRSLQNVSPCAGLRPCRPTATFIKRRWARS